MKNKKKLIKSYLFKVKYFIKCDTMSDVLVDYFTESDFNLLRSSGVVDVLEVQQVKRLLVK